MKRILFVDDERRILEGLQRMLRPRRKEWVMTFANSGSEALAILAESVYDVIVSDMRMPDMDGAQLLELVRQQYPGMIRIVLSGQFEMESAMRAVPVAHQFVVKPCDHEKLQEVIERSSGGDSQEPDEATRRMVAAIGELPALPGTYAALVRALDDPEVALDQVGAIVERDVGVAAKVLQLVNSSFFGMSREITTVPNAVAQLGFEVLKQLGCIRRTSFIPSPTSATLLASLSKRSNAIPVVLLRLPRTSRCPRRTLPRHRWPPYFMMSENSFLRLDRRSSSHVFCGRRAKSIAPCTLWRKS